MKSLSEWQVRTRKEAGKLLQKKEDELDLILSPPYFLAPVSNSETREIFAFQTQLQKMMTACESLPIKNLMI